MNELENLLNSLIKIWWKPWNVDVNCDISIKIENNRIKIYFELKTWVIVSNSGGMSLRELVSLESWLLQFVCDNRVVKENDDVRIKNYQWDNECDTNCCYDDYEYRIIASALTPEEELGQFLVNNIKIDG